MNKKVVFFCAFMLAIHVSAMSQKDTNKHTLVDTFFITDKQQPTKILKVTDTLRIQYDPNKSDKFDTSLFVGSLALLISLVSVVISYLTLRIQRKHNINSLKPYLIVLPSDYQKCIQIELKNQGTGVAIIKKWCISKGSEIRSSFIEWLPKKSPSDFSYLDYYVSYETEIYALCINDTLNCLEVRFDKDNEIHARVRAELRGILKDLIVEVFYEDIYENKYTCTCDLISFSRIDYEFTNPSPEESKQTQQEVSE